MSMFIALMVLILSTALFFFYLQNTCQRILRHVFDREYFRAVVNANRLEFASIRRALQDLKLLPDYSKLRTPLKCDFEVLTYLLKNAANLNQRYSREERLLMLYFRFEFFSLRMRHRLRWRERQALLNLTEILQYFANVVGQRVDSVRFDNQPPDEFLMKL
jgi:hypothetical protein